MARIFLSHSSADKGIALTLATDLRQLGHEVWLDEWSIKVGESIVAEIEHGLAGADYVVILLSESACASSWVEREWRAKYWEEVQARRVMILPVLLEECELPYLLRDRKYADFRAGYAVGLVQLMGAVAPVLSTQHVGLSLAAAPAYTQRVAEILAKVQARATPLAQCLAEALPIAQAAGDDEVARFCRKELAGWESDDVMPAYRQIEVFVSPYQLNLQHLAWQGNAARVMEYLRRSDDFAAVRTALPTPVAAIEAKLPNDPNGGVYSTRVTVTSDTGEPMSLNAYGAGDVYADTLEAIRGELTKRLLGLLPEAPAAS